MSRESQADIVDKVVEHVIMMTALSEYKIHPSARRILDRPIDPKSFRRIQPMTEQLDNNGDYLIFSDAVPADIETALNVALTADNEDSADGFSVQRFRAIPANELRGRTRRTTRYVVDHSALLIDGHGSGFIQRSLMGSNDGAQWRNVSNLVNDNADLDRLFTGHVRMAYGLAFTRQMFWHVEIGWEGFPTVLIPTDPVGAREVFKLRDIPEGKARRAALRHWVSEHYRQKRDSPGDEVKVREHLRAATSFRWNGMICNIEVSKTDLDKAERARIEREAERQTS